MIEGYRPLCGLTDIFRHFFLGFRANALHPRLYAAARIRGLKTDTPVGARCFIGWLAASTLAISRIASGDALAQEVPVFQVKAEGDGANAAISIEEKVAAFDIHSRSGIGRATIEHVSGALPEKIVVRLHLKGLEEFQLSYGRTVVTARVSSSDSRNIVQSVDPPGSDKRSITPDSPFRMEVRIASDQVAPRIPLEQGSFEITLPKDVFGKGRRSFSIRWIDFYR